MAWLGPSNRAYTSAAPTSAPANLTLTNQGTNKSVLTASAVSGATSYNWYRNGVLISNTPTPTYTDTTATATQITTLDAPAALWQYAVAAVANGIEGPKATGGQVWLYQGSNGGSTCSNSDFNYGITGNYADTSGSPIGGGTDFKGVWGVNVGGGWQPYSNTPLVDTTYCLDVNAYTRFAFDVKMDSVNPMYIAIYSRFPFGDVYTWKSVHVADYITQMAGAWQTVDLPLSDVNMGQLPITASIGAPYGTVSYNGGSQTYPYATLTVSAKGSGSGLPDVDNGGYILNTGLSGGVWVVSNGQNGSVGTFQVVGPSITSSTVVASRAMTYQRSNFYKCNLGLTDGNPGGNIYFNNVRCYHP